jgi:hypothetical protein
MGAKILPFFGVTFMALAFMALAIKVRIHLKSNV